jgi:hypothetical protein
MMKSQYIEYTVYIEGFNLNRDTDVLGSNNFRNEYNVNV